MVRNNRRNDNYNTDEGRLIILDETCIDLKTPIRPVKDFLKNTYFDMIKERGEKIECTVCLDEIDCKKCCSLLSCGHSYHLCCIMKCESCPLCRG